MQSTLIFQTSCLKSLTHSGWSSKWSIIDIEKLENYLSKCSSIHKVGILKPFEKMLFFSQVELPSSEQLSQLPFDIEVYTDQHLVLQRKVGSKK